MKKTTIILFSCALILIVAGAVLCFIGTQTGDVFDNTVISDTPVSMDIGKDINTIVIDLDEVTVNVNSTTDDHSYIKTTNVDEKYVKSKSSTELNITDKTDYLDLVMDTVQNFTGLRNVFFREQVTTGAKTVDIFISEKGDVDLTKLKIVTNKGVVKINDMHTKTLYYIEVKEATEYITLNNVDASDITLNVADGSVNLTDCTASHESTNVWSTNGIKANLGSGTFYMTPSSDNDCKYYYNLSATNGSITAPKEELIVKNENVSTYNDGVPVDKNTTAELTPNAPTDGKNDTEEVGSITFVTVVNENGSVVIQKTAEDHKESEKTE